MFRIRFLLKFIFFTLEKLSLLNILIETSLLEPNSNKNIDYLNLYIKDYVNPEI